MRKRWKRLAGRTYSELTRDLSADSSLPARAAQAPAQKNSLQPGDPLSQIAKQFYADVNAYMKIIEADKDQLDDPNRMHAGQELLIPTAG